MLKKPPSVVGVALRLMMFDKGGLPRPDVIGRTPPRVLETKKPADFRSVGRSLRSSRGFDKGAQRFKRVELARRGVVSDNRKFKQLNK